MITITNVILENPLLNDNDCESYGLLMTCEKNAGENFCDQIYIPYTAFTKADAIVAHLNNHKTALVWSKLVANVLIDSIIDIAGEIYYYAIVEGTMILNGRTGA